MQSQLGCENLFLRRKLELDWQQSGSTVDGVQMLELKPTKLLQLRRNDQALKGTGLLDFLITTRTLLEKFTTRSSS